MDESKDEESKMHDLRPVEIVPRPEWAEDNPVCNEILGEWISIYKEFQNKAEALIERAGGKTKMKIIMVNDNPLRGIVIKFLPEMEPL